MTNFSTSNLAGNNRSIETIVAILLEVPHSKPELLQQSADIVIKLITSLVPSGDNYNISLPYKDITDVIYNRTTDIPTRISDSLKSGFREEINSNINKLDKSEQTKILSCYDKIVEHIQLAITQKEFITKTTQHAFSTAREAEKIAQEAKNTAEKAEQTYKSMFANYITILGIFTAITVTLFGGLNVINSLASIANQDQSSIIFMAALLICCITLMLYFLANTIKWITHTYKKNSLHYIFFIILAGCILTMAYPAYKHFIIPAPTTEATHTEKNTEVAQIKETVETTTAEKNTNSVDDKNK